MLNEELQKRWGEMLKNIDSEVQIRALTEIELAALQKQTCSEVRLGGPGCDRDASRTGLSYVLRNTLVEKLKAANPTVRALALLAFTRWEEYFALEHIEKALKDDDASVRMAAIHAATITNATDLLPRIVQMAENDVDLFVRAKAVDAIKWFIQHIYRSSGKAIQTRDDITHLKRVLAEVKAKDPAPYVRFVAEALDKP
ncbi:MAG: HEAT repeat domain-containing protein [Candidatus Hadarchaeum sp.]